MPYMLEQPTQQLLASAVAEHPKQADNSISSQGKCGHDIMQCESTREEHRSRETSAKRLHGICTLKWHEIVQMCEH